MGKKQCWLLPHIIHKTIPKWSVIGKGKSYNHRNCRNHIGENLHDLGLGKYFLKITHIYTSKEEFLKTEFYKHGKFCLLKNSINKIKRNWKLKVQIRRKCLQSIYPRKDLWPEYIKNPYNTIIRRKHSFKNDHKNCIATSEKKARGWPTAQEQMINIISHLESSPSAIMKWPFCSETNVRGFTSGRWLSSNAQRSVPWKGEFMAHVSHIRLDNMPSFSEQSTQSGWGETTSYSGWCLSTKQDRDLPVPGKTAPCDQTSQVWGPGWSGVFSSKKQPGRKLPTAALE